MAKKKAARPAATRAKKTATKAVRRVSTAAAGARAAASRAVTKARQTATRQVAAVRARASSLVKTVTRAAAATAKKAKASKGLERVTAAMRRVAPKAASKAVKPKTARKAAKTTAAKRKVVVRKAAVVARPAPKPAQPAKAARKPAAPARVAAKTTPARRPAAVETTRKAPALDRPRKTVDNDIHGVPSSLGMGGIASAARSGHAEIEHKLHEHTSSSPALTAGDVDADWASADSIGDEAPGGDNPTPDQDVVEEIGRALGVEYHDDEELQGGDEIAERDKHRWELDPESSDDFDER